MSAALKRAAARKTAPKKATPSAAAKRAPAAKDQRAAEMLREIRVKGEALTDRIDRLLARLA
jgi:hypothetical protein